MFIRKHRIGRLLYTEVLQSYRDPETRRPKHRCLVRWQGEGSLAEEIGKAQFSVVEAADRLGYWLGVANGTVRPRFPRHRAQAQDGVFHADVWLGRQRRRLAGLLAVQAAGLAADDAEIERAERAAAEAAARLSARCATICQAAGVSAAG